MFFKKIGIISLFLIWGLFLFLAIINVNHRTQIDDYLITILLIYGIFFNGLLFNLNANSISIRTLMTTIGSGLIFFVFYVFVLIFIYFFFKTPKDPFIRGEFYTLLPSSPWQWLGYVVLLALFLGLVFFICHEIVNPIRRHIVALFSHVMLVSFLILLLYGVGVQLFFEQEVIHFEKRVILYLTILMISLIHFLGTIKIDVFVKKEQNSPSKTGY